MPLTAEERKARRALINKRYYEKKKLAAQKGDPEAAEEWQRVVHSRRLASVKSFINHNATEAELLALHMLVKRHLDKLLKNEDDDKNDKKAGRTS